MTTDLSTAEAATVARFDAAPDAEEALRLRVATAMYRVDTDATASDEDVRDYVISAEYLPRSDAAIAVMRGDDA